jgi:hypothetical protein
LKTARPDDAPSDCPLPLAAFARLPREAEIAGPRVRARIDRRACLLVDCGCGGQSDGGESAGEGEKREATASSEGRHDLPLGSAVLLTRGKIGLSDRI